MIVRSQKNYLVYKFKEIDLMALEKLVLKNHFQNESSFYIGLL